MHLTLITQILRGCFGVHANSVKVNKKFVKILNRHIRFKKMGKPPCEAKVLKILIPRRRFSRKSKLKQFPHRKKGTTNINLDKSTKQMQERKEILLYFMRRCL